MDREGIVIQVALKDVKIKAKETKMREEDVPAKSRNIQVTILQWQWGPAQVFLRNL